ncbi:PREDICTED: uncharacterized protein LOC108567035 [Nicrophorus vespilloides]|uniref:Uncharacterized protein LOC108567035 n=1 Tax=Nicrophorus vespilloides TaxID=110193 RepID=A0ABM1N7B2_NICVS|nr:PREDICTED: uncharacterized protein LOC108567035 [Nicrophorus vespilloides]
MHLRLFLHLSMICALAYTLPTTESPTAIDLTTSETTETSMTTFKTNEETTELDVATQFPIQNVTMKLPTTTTTTTTKKPSSANNINPSCILAAFLYVIISMY